MSHVFESKHQNDSPCQWQTRHTEPTSPEKLRMKNKKAREAEGSDNGGSSVFVSTVIRVK